MPLIEIHTRIAAPIERVFDLSRSIDLHKTSLAHTHEQAIAGVTKGLIGMDEEVTWRARHFGVYLQLTSKITAFEAPYFFVDEMLRGPFKSFRHEHHFTSEAGQTLMKDVFEYTAPLGVLGRMADAIFLKRYMRKLLEGRNAVIKRVGEGVKSQKV